MEKGEAGVGGRGRVREGGNRNGKGKTKTMISPTGGSTSPRGPRRDKGGRSLDQVRINLKDREKVRWFWET